MDDWKADAECADVALKSIHNEIQKMTAVKANGENMKFNDHDKALVILDTATEHLEKLGICVATFVGGGAMVQFSSVVFPLYTPVPIAIGFLLGIAALFLALLVTYKAWNKTTESVKNHWAKGLVLVPILIMDVFFVIAGAAAGFRALTH